MHIESARDGKSQIDRIVYVSREYNGLAGSGGMKDVAEGLCTATAARGIDTHIFLPYYRVIDRNIARNKIDLKLKESLSFEAAMNYTHRERRELVKIFSGQLQPNLTVHLISSARYSYLMDSDGTVERHSIYTYTKSEADALGRPGLEGEGYHDFFAMNVLLVKATLHALGKLQIKPDIIHCHDAHAALLPLIAQTSKDHYVTFLQYVPTVITVHNAGKGYHQETADLNFASSICGVPRESVEGCLRNGVFDPLFIGGLFGTAIHTVSENYARELRQTGFDWTTGWLGHALSGYGVKLLGITNGVDPKAFNPENGKKLGLAANFSVVKAHFRGKETCKRSLLKNLERGEAPETIELHGTINYRKEIPLFTFVGRFVEQKGYETLADALSILFKKEEDTQVLGLGDGGPEIIKLYEQLARTYPGRVCIAKGYSQSFANQVYAAGDFFIIPSLFEPCGLTDLFAQLMGNVPIVHSIGGLVKTLDGRFGFSYRGDSLNLLEALSRALKVYREPKKKTLRRIQEDAVKNIIENLTWDKVFEKKYLPLYRDAIAKSEPDLPYSSIDKCHGIADNR